MQFRSLFLSLLFLGIACSSIAPTPLLIGRVTKLNDEVVARYVDCSQGANYVPTKEGCDPELLGVKVDELLDLSLQFVRADIKQPHGYDIHLATSLIYFRIAARTLNEYTEKERIARQFFEIQKANSSRAIDTARYWWAWYASSSASKQFFEDRMSLTLERKADLLLALEAGTLLLNTVDGPRLVRLQQALGTLQYVIDSIQ